LGKAWFNTRQWLPFLDKVIKLKNAININNKQIMIKEIKVRYQHSHEDYQSKVGHAIRFFKNNDQVRIIVMLRGREITHPEIGEKLLLNFAKSLEEYASAALPPVVEERQVSVLFTPKITL
jgi:translation initiation factor IF-3